MKDLSQFEGATQLVERAMELGAVNAKPQSVADGFPFVIVPDGAKALSLEQFQPTRKPQYIQRTVAMLESSSFCDYVNRFKLASSLIFVVVSDTGAKFKAVLDYHGAPASPEFCGHTALYETLPTKEWADWMANDKKAMDQVEFASFIEDHMHLIVEPAGADLLELITNIEGHANARFESAMRLQSGGMKIAFNEDVEVRGGNAVTKEGSIELPKTIAASIAPFQGAEAVAVTARLKFRIKKPSLVLWYETVQPHIIVRDALKRVLAEVNEKTSLLPLIGSC